MLKLDFTSLKLETLKQYLKFLSVHHHFLPSFYAPPPPPPPQIPLCPPPPPPQTTCCCCFPPSPPPPHHHKTEPDSFLTTLVKGIKYVLGVFVGVMIVSFLLYLMKKLFRREAPTSASVEAAGGQINFSFSGEGSGGDEEIAW
ncbi:hypothetical protein TSUD_42480 [Trifolium subterraneum]|uniref:Uncharacterized protein n=1 Tax=Trifolium subterraneum TaxID=3900 RepID=A0A2Z6LW26_TRISU|nr:hypothetical protein TSUD_42480 [Trifolium subterraneum]